MKRIVFGIHQKLLEALIAQKVQFPNQWSNTLYDNRRNEDAKTPLLLLEM